MVGKLEPIAGGWEGWEGWKSGPADFSAWRGCQDAWEDSTGPLCEPGLPQMFQMECEGKTSILFDFHQISKLQNKSVISAHFILQLSISRRPQGMKLPCSQQYRTGGHWSHISIFNWYRNFRNLHRNTVYEDDLLKFCAVLRGFLNMLGSGRFGSLSPPRRE